MTHCEIADFYYTGVSIGWVWGYSGSMAQGNKLTYCHIHRIGHRALGDMGGGYTLGTSYGTRIVNNVIQDVDSFTYGGWGLWLGNGRTPSDKFGTIQASTAGFALGGARSWSRYEQPDQTDVCRRARRTARPLVRDGKIRKTEK